MIRYAISRKYGINDLFEYKKLKLKICVIDYKYQIMFVFNLTKPNEVSLIPWYYPSPDIPNTANYNYYNNTGCPRMKVVVINWFSVSTPTVFLEHPEMSTICTLLSSEI